MSASSDSAKPDLTPLTFTGSSCFVPAGAWDKAAIPIYNPNDTQKRVRLLFTQGLTAGFPVVSQDILIGPHSYQTFSNQGTYAIVEQFDA